VTRADFVNSKTCSTVITLYSESVLWPRTLCGAQQKTPFLFTNKLFRFHRVQPQLYRHYHYTADGINDRIKTSSVQIACSVVWLLIYLLHGDESFMRS